MIVNADSYQADDSWASRGSHKEGAEAYAAEIAIANYLQLAYDPAH
jgi:hypothetical protein